MHLAKVSEAIKALEKAAVSQHIMSSLPREDEWRVLAEANLIKARQAIRDLCN